jgi:putative SOS response-associated peptidase YedK
MCGRIAMTLPQDMVLFFDAVSRAGPAAEPRWNICPTQMVSVIISGEAGREARPMRWGFLPHWYRTAHDGPLIINARAEGIAEKPAFREACRRRRAIIPATGFYEWTRAPDGGRDPWLMEPSFAPYLAMAAVWTAWSGPEGRSWETVAVVTCANNAAMGRLHDRMPVLLDRADWPLWLGEAGEGASRLMRPAPEDWLRFTPVSRAINGAKYDRADLAEPVERGFPD